MFGYIFFFSNKRRHTRWTGDWSSDVCSSDLVSPPKTLTLLPFGLQIVGLRDHADVEPLQLIAGVPKHPAKRAIDVQQSAVFADKRHRVRRTVERVGEQIGRASCRERG